MSNMNTVQHEQQTDFREIINRYLKYWYLFMTAVIVCLVAAFLYLRYATPKYEVSSSILIKQEKRTSNSSDNTKISDLEIVKSSQSVDNKIEELKSVTLMERVVNELALGCSYFLDGTLKDTELYGKSLPVKLKIDTVLPEAYTQDITIHLINNHSFKFDDGASSSTYNFGQKIRRGYGVFELEKVKTSDFRPQKIKVKIKKPSQLAKAYQAALVINAVNENADVLKMKFVTPIPQKGVDILNKLIEVANKEELEDKNRIAKNTIQFIDERLKFLITDLTDVEKNVEALKQQNHVTDVGANAQMYLQQSGVYDQQLAEAEMQLSVLNSLEQYVNRSNGGLVPSSLGIQDQTLSNLIQKYNELQLEKQRTLRTAQPDNPVVINLDEQLAGLRSSIRENLSNIKKGLQITRNNYRANTAQYQSKIQSVPAVERELQQIQRQQSVKQNLYLYLLQKREESALALAATVNNSRVIDEVNVNPNPVEPKKQLIYLCAFILGLGIPAAGIYTKDLLNNKVLSVKDIETLTDVKVLGEISHSEVKGNLVVKPDSRTTISELFRLIRTNLKFHTSQIDNKVILVTSTMSGEGKTFFCSNLGSTLALTDKKVVVLEFDLRNPKLIQGFDLNAGNGITDYIIDPAVSIDSIIKPVNGSPNLFVIGAGETPPNPAELLLHERVDKMITALKERFDYIILDSSPVGQVADAFSLVPYSDTSIYVVRYNFTTKNQLNILNDISDKLKHPMVVFNDAEVDNYRGYGYGYGYLNDNSKRMKLLG